MAIDSTTNFTRYQCDAGRTPDGKRVIKRISANQGAGDAQFRGYLRPINNNYLEGWNPNDSEFQEIKTRVEEGRVRAEYKDRHGTVYSASALPAHLQWMRDADPIQREIDLVSAQENETVGPGVLVVYQAATTQPSDEPPAFEGDIIAWLEAIEDAGFSYRAAPTTTGSELLWSNKNNYLKAGSVEASDWAGWTTDARRYSIDNGLTYTITPPHAAHQITHIQTFRNGVWETEPVEPKFQAAAGVGTAVENRSTEPFGLGDRYIQANSLLPAEINTRGIQAGNTTEIGIRLFVRTEWRGEPILRGLVWVPYDVIPLTRPHEVDENDDLVPLPNRNMLIVMSQGGAMGWGIVNSLSRLTDYHGGQPRFLCHWRSNPDVTLQRAVAAADGTIRIKEKPHQIDTGDALYVTGGGEAENMRVQSVNRTRQGTEDDPYYIISVARHPVGSAVNPPHDFPIDGTRILAHQATLQHEALVITAKGDLHAASSIRLWAKEDQ